MSRQIDPATLFVTADWLAQHLHAPDIRIFDASWHMPAAGRDPRAEFLAGHIPGAVFFDIDAIADHSTDLPHMLPTPEAFAAGIGSFRKRISRARLSPTVIGSHCVGLDFLLSQLQQPLPR